MINKPNSEKKSSTTIKHTTYHIELVIGAWSLWFGHKKTKLLIAEALNKWTTEIESLALNGYLITDYSLYIIVKTNKRSFHRQLAVLYAIMTSIIEYHHHHNLKLNFKEEHEILSAKLLYIRPFEKRDFYNEDLIKLLLGKRIESVYFDLELANLIDNIRHYNYCSAIDYSGAEGPVKVSLLKEEDQTPNLTAHVKL